MLINTYYIVNSTFFLSLVCKHKKITFLEINFLNRKKISFVKIDKYNEINNIVPKNKIIRKVSARNHHIFVLALIISKIFAFTFAPMSASGKCAH